MEPPTLRRVIIESPYAGDVEGNKKYVRAALRDSLLRGEAPFASHALYTLRGVLDDLEPSERALGMDAGWTWGEAAEATVFYFDRGVSKGMREGVASAIKVGRPIEYRSLGVSWGCQCIGPDLLQPPTIEFELPFCPTCKRFCGYPNPCRDRICTTGSGRTDGHMTFVRFHGSSTSSDGVMVCAFCGEPE